MFGSKGWGWKMAAALALIALMGVDAERRGGPLNPPLWRCLAEPARWDGTRVWLPNARILSTDDSGFDITATEARVRVRGKAPGVAGDPLALTGVFRAEGPRIDLERSHRSRWTRDWRWVSEGVSILVLLVVLANFARHFLFRPELLQIRRRD